MSNPWGSAGLGGTTSLWTQVNPCTFRVQTKTMVEDHFPFFSSSWACLMWHAEWLLEKKMTSSWMASSWVSHWKCHLFLSFCLYKLVFFKQSFTSGFMIQSTWCYHKFLTSLHPRCHSCTTLPQLCLQSSFRLAARTVSGKRSCLFCCWVWGSFLFIFLYFFFKPETSLMWLVECLVSGLGQHRNGCREFPASSRSAMDTAPTVSLLPFTRWIVCLCFQKGLLGVFLLFFFRMFTSKLQVQCGLFASNQCCKQHTQNSLAARESQSLVNFLLNDACPILPSLSQLWRDQHETTELILITSVNVSVTFGVAKQQVHLTAGANKITNTRLRKRGVCVYRFSTSYVDARRRSGSWMNLLLCH